MSKIFRITLIVVFLISCSNDEDNSPNNFENANELILGTWNKVSTTENGIEIPLNTCDSQESYSWDSSGNYTEILYGNQTEPCGNAFENNGSYTIIGINITFNLGNDIFTQEIQNITNEQLILKEVYIDNGTTITFIDTYEKNLSEPNDDLVQINDNIDINNIYAKWSLRKSEYRNYGNFEEIPYIITGCAEDRYSDYQISGEIKVYRQETTTVSNEYEQNGEIIREYECVGEVEHRASRSFSTNGNKINYINNNGSSSNAIIQDLSENELILLWNDNLDDFDTWKNRETYIKID